MSRAGISRGYTRRQFARTAAGIAAAVAFPATHADINQSGAALPAHLVYDARLPDISAITHLNSRPVIAQHAFVGDVTPLWQGVLAAAWKEGVTSTLGYTRYAEFFLLSTLAREQGYVVADEQRHGDRIGWLLLPRPVAAGDPRA